MQTLTLRYGGLSRWSDTTKIVMPDDFTFAVDGMTTTNAEYVAVAKLNGVEQKYKITGEVTIPRDFLSAGKLEIVIGVYLDGERILEFVAEPIYIVEELGELSALPEITALEEQISAAENALSEYKARMQTQLQEIASAITTLNTNLQTLQTEISGVRSELERHEALEKNDYDPLRV